MNPTISLAPSGNLLLELPHVLAGGRTHSVEIPFTLAGLALLKRTLRARQADASAKLATQASPTASQIHEFLQSQQREAVASAKQVADFYNVRIDL